jgi:AraC-like DNA-binding protein
MHASLLASATLGVWRALEHEGYDADALFKQAGLDPEALPQPGARFASPAVKRLWPLVLETTGDPCFGLKVGQLWHPSSAHALGYAWLASDSLLEAFQRLERYYRVITTNREHVELVSEREGYRFVWDDSETRYEISDTEFDEGFAAVISLCRFSTGEPMSPMRIRMRRAPPPCEHEFAAFFRAPIEYSAGENSMLFDRRRIEAKLLSRNIQIAMECERTVQSYLAQLDRDDIAANIKVQLLIQLPSGTMTDERVAKALHLSVRTMQRRLHDEGTTFKQLLDDTRRELALQYVRDPAVSINEMTYLLGYSEPANFSRAFKRWTGQSPRAVRAA